MGGRAPELREVRIILRLGPNTPPVPRPLPTPTSSAPPAPPISTRRRKAALRAAGTERLQPGGRRQQRRLRSPRWRQPRGRRSLTARRSPFLVSRLHRGFASDRRFESRWSSNYGVGSSSVNVGMALISVIVDGTPVPLSVALNTSQIETKTSEPKKGLLAP